MKKDVLVLDFVQEGAVPRFVAVECKSGKNGLTPMWNDNLPNPETIYILSSGSANATTLFLGKDVITPAELQCQIDFYNDVIKCLASDMKIVRDHPASYYLIQSRGNYEYEGVELIEPAEAEEIDKQLFISLKEANDALL